MKAVAVKRNQVGAVLSLELGILMAVVASIAIGFGIILGGKLPLFFDHILDQTLWGTEVTLQSNEQAACNLVDNNYNFPPIMAPAGATKDSAAFLTLRNPNSYYNPLCQNKVRRDF